MKAGEDIIHITFFSKTDGFNYNGKEINDDIYKRFVMLLDLLMVSSTYKTKTNECLDIPLLISSGIAINCTKTIFVLKLK